MPVAVSVIVPSDTAKKGLERLAKEAPNVARRVVEDVTLLIFRTARRSLITGPKTGRIYTRGGVTHQASRKGEAPASDTGTLFNHIFMDTGDIWGEVGTTLEYGRILEDPPKLDRPFILPALRAHEKKFEAMIIRELDRL
jgi:hypothetical protein